ADRRARQELVRRLVRRRGRALRAAEPAGAELRAAALARRRRARLAAPRHPGQDLRLLATSHGGRGPGRPRRAEPGRRALARARAAAASAPATRPGAIRGTGTRPASRRA